MADILVSPAERAPKLLALGTVSAVPERFGVDFWWIGHGAKKWGVQRKELRDFVASAEDGRLARERGQMGQMDHVVLMLEGRVRVGGNGAIDLGNSYGRPWTESALWGHLLGLQFSGVQVVCSDDITHTARLIRIMHHWSQKEKHYAMQGRESIASPWGTPTNREFAIYVLSSLPGVGVELAGRIWDHFGRIPFGWLVGVEELCQVPGIGKKKAEKMIAALGVAGEGFLK